MANPVRGEVSLDVGDQHYVLVFGTNAICALEEHFGVKAPQLAHLFDESTELGIKELRVILWAGLQDRHEEFTLKAVGRLIDEVGMGEMTERLQEAFGKAWPDAAEAAKSARPRKARRAAGTGSSSSSSGAS